MPDTFEKDIVKKFGARGSPVVERELKTTDLEELTEQVESTVQPFCNCGAPITATAEVYRCCDCELISCRRCHIELSRWNYCPTCARRRFDLDKQTFFTLLFIQKGLLAAGDLVTVTTQGGEVVEIEIPAVADALFRNDYVTDDGALTSQGQEAFHVGNQLYGDDADVQAVMDRIRIQEVANG